MAILSKVISAYNGDIALPLAVWCVVSFSIFVCVYMGFSSLWKYRRRCCVTLFMPSLWVIHSFVLVRTFCKLYFRLWVADWHEVRSAQFINARYSATVICFMMAVAASVFLFSSCMVMIWDLLRPKEDESFSKLPGRQSK